MLTLNRRNWLAATGGLLGACAANSLLAEDTTASHRVAKDLRIVDMQVTPIALPDPPILAAGGCHGPYFLRNIIELKTHDGIVGIGETHGGEDVTKALLKCRELIIGQSAFAYRGFAADVQHNGNSVYAGIELACLDAIGRATGRRLCELLGGPVREQVEFAAYLFYRYAADDPKVLDDPRIVDQRGRGENALDQWGDVRTAEAMAEMAWKFHQRWGFRVQKLKAGVLPPDIEYDTLVAINERFHKEAPLRIDPNGRWTVETAVRIGDRMQGLPIEYYEDPVQGQLAMAEVRRKTGLTMSTNSCVTRFHHIPRAIETKPIDVVLGDHHGWGGITAFQSLGTICEATGWGLSQHSNNHAGITMAAMIHVGAAVPQLTYASDTHYIWLVEGTDIIEGPNLKIDRGHMRVPDKPGVGVTLDRDKLSRAHETYIKSGMRRRDDASTMRRIVPGWKRLLL